MADSFSHITMNVKRTTTFFAVAFIAALVVTSVVTITESTVFAQNTTGNMTAEGNATAWNVTDTDMTGSISKKK
jgi:hypothetical protein